MPAGARPRRPTYIYSGAPHLFAHLPKHRPLPVQRTAAWGRRARILSGGHALTAPPLLWVVPENAGGNRLAFGDRFCLEPVLRAKPVPSAGRVSLHRRGRFVFTWVNKTCRYPGKKKNFFFPPLGDLNLYPIFLVLLLPRFLFYCRVVLSARPIFSETRKWPTRACNCWAFQWPCLDGWA